MSEPLDVELVAEAEQRAEAEVLELIKALQERNVGPGGETFGTQHMSREDRILAFLDDAASGALDHLKVLNERAYIEYVRQYNRDIAATPQMKVSR